MRARPPAFPFGAEKTCGPRGSSQSEGWWQILYLLKVSFLFLCGEYSSNKSLNTVANATLAQSDRSPDYDSRRAAPPSFLPFCRSKEAIPNSNFRNERTLIMCRKPIFSACGTNSPARSPSSASPFLNLTLSFLSSLAPFF